MAVCWICIFNLLQSFDILHVFSINEHLQKNYFQWKRNMGLVAHKVLFFVDIKCGPSDVRYNCGVSGCARKKFSLSKFTRHFLFSADFP
jgi:hypothetical protein